MFREKLKTKLNDSEAGILDVITWIANYKGETLASKLRYNKFSKMQILYMAFDVQENLAKLSKHYMLLLDLSQTYNSFFAAEIKQDRLANITHRFEQLKDAVEITKTTFGNFKEQFSQDLSKEHLVQVSDNSEKEAYVNSLPCRFSIGQGMVVNRKIALTYSQCANMLCEEVERFYQLVLASLMMCQSLMQEEKNLMGDIKELEFIYNECFENAWETIQATIDTLESVHPTDEDIKRAKECNNNFPLFLVKYFHKMNNLEFTRHVMAVKFLLHLKEKAKARSEGIILFPDNPNMEQTAKNTAMALDSLNLKTRQQRDSDKRQFNTKAIIALKEQLGYDGAMETFVAYLKQNYHGDIGFPKPSALSTEKGKEYKLANMSDLASQEKWKKAKLGLDSMKQNIRAFIEGNRATEMLNLGYASVFC